MVGVSVSGPKYHVTHGVGGTSSRGSDCSWMGKLSSRGLLRCKGETSRVMDVSTAVVRLSEGACVDGLTVSGPKYNAIDGVGRTEEVSATDCGVRAEMVVWTAVVRVGEVERGRERERVAQAHRAPCDRRRRTHKQQCQRLTDG